jgi:hypothetical protein
MRSLFYTIYLNKKNVSITGIRRIREKTTYIRPSEQETCFARAVILLWEIFGSYNQVPEIFGAYHRVPKICTNVNWESPWYIVKVLGFCDREIAGSMLNVMSSLSSVCRLFVSTLTSA